MMTVSIESYKGGQGATTVAAVLALQLSEHGPVRLCADRSEAAAVLGVPDGGVVLPLGNLEVVDGWAPDDRMTVIDANQADADLRYVVVRNCFLALRATLAAPIGGVTGIIAMIEPGRPLTTGDMEAALGLPFAATVELTDQAARTIDAGLLRREARWRYPTWRTLRPLVDTILHERVR